MRQQNDKGTAEQSTPKVNNTNQINPKSLLHKNMIFKDALLLPPHSLFRIPSYRIVLDSISIGYNSMSP